MKGDDLIPRPAAHDFPERHAIEYRFMEKDFINYLDLDGELDFHGVAIDAIGPNKVNYRLGARIRLDSSYAFVALTKSRLLEELKGIMTKAGCDISKLTFEEKKMKRYEMLNVMTYHDVSEITFRHPDEGLQVGTILSVLDENDLVKEKIKIVGIGGDNEDRKTYSVERGQFDTPVGRLMTKDKVVLLPMEGSE